MRTIKGMKQELKKAHYTLSETLAYIEWLENEMKQRDKVYVIIELYDYVEKLEDYIFFNTYEEAEEYVNNTGDDLYIQELELGS